VYARGTPTTDRECAKCDGIIHGRAFGSPTTPKEFMCPDTIESICPAALAPPAPPPVYRYLDVSLGLSGNTQNGIAFGAMRVERLEEALATCITTFLGDNTTVDDLSITSNSLDAVGLSVDFDVLTGDVVDMSNSQLEGVFADLECLYEDINLVYTKASLQANLFTTSTTTRTTTMTTTVIKATTGAPATAAPTLPAAPSTVAVVSAPATSVDVVMDLDYNTTDLAALTDTLRDVLRTFGIEWPVNITLKQGSIIATITTSNSSDLAKIESKKDAIAEAVVQATVNATTAAPTTVETAAATASDDGLGGGAIAGIVIAILFCLIAVVVGAVLYNKKKQEADAGRSFERSGSISSMTAPSESGYLGVSATEEGSVFSNQVAEENRKLRSEVAVMQEKIALKDASSHHQQVSQKAAQSKFEKAIAARIGTENKALADEIKAMQSEIKKMKNQTAYQKAAAEQVKLLAVKTQLEEEITRVNEIEQVALHAISEFDASLESGAQQYE